MSSSSAIKVRKREYSRSQIEPGHHVTSVLTSETPPGTSPDSTGPSTPSSSVFLNGIDAQKTSRGLIHRHTRWVIDPSISFKVVLLPWILYFNWAMLAPYVARDLENPFAGFLFISHQIPTSPNEDPLYAKGYLDIVYILYYVVVWSFIRQIITTHLCRHIAKYFRLRKSKMTRFGEQGYALLYFAIMGAVGVRIMSQLPTWWFRTEHFYIGYPHWDMPWKLKCYYLLQFSYWLQQLLVIILGLEKPRKDHAELIAHHIITLWLIGWSYLVNMTRIGNAVFVSMDIPDVFLAFSKLLNYLQWERTKVVSFLAFICVWTYFRHWLNLVMIYRGWHEFDLIPDWAREWNPAKGVWFPSWMKFQVYFPIACLQAVNLFWYYLVMRILFRTITMRETTDDRSEDEEDEGVDNGGKEE